MTRPYVSGYPGYGYQDQQYAGSAMHGSSPMQGVEMQYSPAYVQDVARQQNLAQASSHSSYGQYAQGQMAPPAAQPSMYETMSHYQPRQSTAIEVMSTQLGSVPQYIQHGEQAGMTLPAPQYSTSQPDQAMYPHATMPRAQVPSQYPQGQEYLMPETQPSQPTQPSAADQEALQDELRQYEQQLRSTFDAIMAGRVSEAAEQVLAISRWLVGAAVPLGMCLPQQCGDFTNRSTGLHHDDKDRYEERLLLWRRFNLCWEALGQKQKDITEQAYQSGRQPPDILSAETIKRLIDDLIALGDQLENYGLVDYELGIAEEQIVHIFMICQDLLQRDSHDSRATRARQPP
jgi:hypothetical protein